MGLPPEQSLQLPFVTINNESANKLSIVPPICDDVMSAEEEDDVNNEVEQLDERPLTRQELDKRTLKEFTRKNVNSTSGLVRVIS